jgi:hypothetical protein
MTHGSIAAHAPPNSIDKGRTIERRRVTYCDWGDSARNPATFNQITSELITLARNEGCLFMRKVKIIVPFTDATSIGKRTRNSFESRDEEINGQVALLRMWLHLVENMSIGSGDMESVVIDSLQLVSSTDHNNLEDSASSPSRIQNVRDIHVDNKNDQNKSSLLDR